MHYYERNIADINHEYTSFLVHIISPLIYEGIKSMYDKSLQKEIDYNNLSKNNVNVKNPGVLKIFQHCLKNIPTLNINLIECEMIRIRDTSKHADIFEKLIKAVIKSQIILLTYNASGKQCKLVNEKFHEKIDIKIFIHKIYIECARQFYNNPELFWHGYANIEIKKNQKDSLQIIEKSIYIAIKEIIPMQDILTEYLKNDYIVEDNLQDRTNKIKNMLENRPEDNINFFDDEDKKVLITEEENNNEFINDNINDIENLLRETDNNIQENIEYIENQENKINDSIDDEEEYKQKLASFGDKSLKSKNIQNIAQNDKQINNNNNNDNNNDNNDNGDKKSEDEKINIVQNNAMDDKNYYNALFN
jgi:hypothetical protein